MVNQAIHPAWEAYEKAIQSAREAYEKARQQTREANKHDADYRRSCSHSKCTLQYGKAMERAGETKVLSR